MKGWILSVFMGMMLFLNPGFGNRGWSQTKKEKQSKSKYSPHDSALIKKRHIPLEGQSNFRDMGGYPTRDGRTVKWGVFYRSGELNRLTPADINRLDSLGIRQVIDFRSKGEIEERGNDRLPEGVRYDSLTIDPEYFSHLILPAFQAANPKLMPDSVMYHLNQELVFSFTPVFGKFMQIAASDTAAPLLMHCTAGKDRTGLASALLLSVLGVPWKVVKDDYMLSNYYRREDNEKQMAAVQKMFAEANKLPPSKVDMSRVRPLFVLDSDYLDAAYSEIMREYGSLNNYIRKGLGISDEQRKRIQEKFTE